MSTLSAAAVVEEFIDQWRASPWESVADWFPSRDEQIETSPVDTKPATDQKGTLTWADRVIVLLPLGLGPAWVLTDAETAWTWFFVLPCVLAMMNGGWIRTGGTQQVKWAERPQYKFDQYFNLIRATTILSAVPGLALWAVLKAIGAQ